MRIYLAFVVALTLPLPLLAAEPHAHPYDAKGLARYDASYVKCESQFPDMRGHGDEAYLNLWRVKPDDKSKAQLAKLRSSSAYLSERQRAVQAAARTASAASAVSRECQGLWAEYQRQGKPTAKPAK